MCEVGGRKFSVSENPAGRPIGLPAAGPGEDFVMLARQHFQTFKILNMIDATIRPQLKECKSGGWILIAGFWSLEIPHYAWTGWCKAALGSLFRSVLVNVVATRQGNGTSGRFGFWRRFGSVTGLLAMLLHQNFSQTPKILASNG
jgi:hypothetical protein